MTRVRALSAILLVLTFIQGPAAAHAAEKAGFTVSSCMADGSAEPRYPYQRPTLAETFAERISLREGFAVRAVRSTQWRKVPAGTEADRHVSLVHVRLGPHHDFLALLHGGPHGSFRFAARAEAIDREVQYWFTVATGRHQIDRNAPVDLIAHFAAQYPAPWPTGRSSRCASESQPARTGDTAVAPPTDAEMTALLPILTAAACTAGLRPTFEELPDTLAVKVQITPEAGLCDLEATLTCGQEKRAACVAACC